MLNGEGGSRLTSISRVGCNWKKFIELSGILTRKKVALRLKGKVYGACVRKLYIVLLKIVVSCNTVTIRIDFYCFKYYAVKNTWSIHAATYYQVKLLICLKPLTKSSNISTTACSWCFKRLDEIKTF